MVDIQLSRPHTGSLDIQAVVPAGRRARYANALRKAVGGFYLSMGGVHVGIVAADAGLYEGFADAALAGFVSTAWNGVFMADPVLWGLTLAAGETALGVLLLRGGRWSAVGWAGVVAFHLALMLFGWGFWLWSLSALALVLPAAVTQWRGAS